MNAGRILATVAFLAGAASLQAQVSSSATQTVSFEVKAINQIAFAAATPSLVIDTATAGSNPTPATAASTWAVTTNQTAKIAASITSGAIPAGLTLKVDLSPPTGASGAGPQTLSATAVDLVTNIVKRAQSGITVTYSLDATLAAGVVPSTLVTVTYTITGS